MDGDYLDGPSVFKLVESHGRALSDHEKASQGRYENLAEKIEALASQTQTQQQPIEGKIMSEDNTAAILAAMGNRDGGTGAAMGGGLGAGLLGGMLGGVLFGRNGLNGNGNVDVNAGIVTPALLASSLAQVTDTAQSTTIMQTLGDIKASIPLAEGQVQLALAGAQADINGNINSSLQVAIAGQAGINKNISDSIATALAGQNDIKSAVAANGAANLTATMNAKFELAQVIRDDGDKTRGLIVAQNDAMLNRQLATAEAALLEQRAIGRSAATEVNVTQTVTQAQVQLQAQAQQQQQFQILANLSATVANLANDIQVVRQGQTIFNSGTMAASGTQAAANTRVS
jgi:hypothetical protein